MGHKKLFTRSSGVGRHFMMIEIKKTASVEDKNQCFFKVNKFWERKKTTMWTVGFATFSVQSTQTSNETSLAKCRSNRKSFSNFSASKSSFQFFVLLYYRSSEHSRKFYFRLLSLHFVAIAPQPLHSCMQWNINVRNFLVPN